MEPSLDDMRRDYPHFRKFVFAKIKEEFERTLPPLEGDDLAAIIEKEGGLPLDVFIQEVESGIKS